MPGLRKERRQGSCAVEMEGARPPIRRLMSAIANPACLQTEIQFDLSQRLALLSEQKLIPGGVFCEAVIGHHESSTRPHPCPIARKSLGQCASPRRQCVTASTQ